MRTKALLITVFVLVLLLEVAAPMAVALAATDVPIWHVVVRGETLFSIGRLYNVSPWTIASANRLVNPNLIYVGQSLQIPTGPGYPQPQQPHQCGSYYTVQRGDTLFRIGITYGISHWRIASANGIYNPNYIVAGQRLFIPCY
jgi:LysM repeat protein